MPEKDFYHISLKALLKNEKGEVLALKASNVGNLIGFYDLPGGRIDVEEFGLPLENVLRRELQEEIGDVKVELSKHPVAYGRHLLEGKHTEDGEDIHVMYMLFEGKYLSGDVVISEEHTGFQWFDLQAIDLETYFKKGNLEAIKMYLERKASL